MALSKIKVVVASDSFKGSLSSLDVAVAATAASIVNMIVH